MTVEPSPICEFGGMIPMTVESLPVTKPDGGASEFTVFRDVTGLLTVAAATKLAIAPNRSSLLPPSESTLAVSPSETAMDTKPQKLLDHMMTSRERGVNSCTAARFETSDKLFIL
jgi:hypothetical protein